MKKFEEKLNNSKQLNIIVTSVILALAAIITIITGIEYRSFSKYDVYFFKGNATEIQKLSKYSPNIEGTVGDCDIYVIKGPEVVDGKEKDCPSILLIGGTHPNEPAGQLASVALLENLVVKGNTIVYIITEANKSAYTHSHPQEASPFYYTLKTKSGKDRTFKFGSRATNTNEQWPNPDIYTHPSGQQLSTNEVRNLNRAYPGKIDGTYTEQIAYGITELIRQNDIKVSIDFHEASPEYNNINSIVYHQKASDLAVDAQFEFEMAIADQTITLNPSPENFRGLTHRELGDHTDTFAFLCETSNAAQGKIRGDFTEDLITYYKQDKFYEKAWSITEAANKGDESAIKLLYAPAATIDVRVARHMSTALAIIVAYNQGVDNPNSSFASCDEARRNHLVSCGKFDFELNLDGDYIGLDNSGNGLYIDTLYELLTENTVGYYLHDPE